MCGAAHLHELADDPSVICPAIAETGQAL